MTAPQNPRVTQADQDCAADVEEALWTESEDIAVIIARYREAAEAASKAREAALVEALEDSLSKYDEAVKACPANKTFLGDRPCPKCGASSQEGCREENRAAFSFISNARAALTKEPDA